VQSEGDVAPVCICFSGLTEYEMPDKDFIVMEVEGLCVGGSGVNGSKDIGYVLFMRGTKGTEKNHFWWIREHLLIPFVHDIRLKYD